MATTRPNLGLQIALIIFVLITIALAVSTFMFFKERNESIVKMEDSEKRLNAAREEKNKAAADLDSIKLCFGRGQQDKVDAINDEFKKDVTLYGVTFPEPGQNYPQMLKSAADAYMTLQGKAADLEKEIATAKAEKLAVENTIKEIQTTFDSSSKAQAAEFLDEQSKNAQARKEFEGAQATLAKQIEEKNKLLNDQMAKAQRDNQSLDKVINEQKDRINKANKELEDFNKTEWNAPDGTVVRVSQREHTVWIDRGRADGIKEQMIFSVYDRTAGNIAGDNVKSKGSIEVIRLLDDHHSEATITKDDLKNPIMKEDKIMNPSYRAGKPEHFAVAGFIDIDNDGQSDMARLLTLISNNGGIVDAMIDDEGKLSGAITSTTKLLVLGERPTENAKSPDSIKSFTRMIKDATDSKVNTMTLADFIKYMGYEGSERSIPLGKSASGVPDGAFKKRPARGTTGGAF